MEIDANGWRIVTEVPVMVRRPSGQLALPRPVHGSGIEALRGFVPGASDKDFILLVAFLVSALRPDGLYPSLVLTGKQGSGKSTLSRLIRSLIDPNNVSLRQVPRTDQDFAIEASNNALVVFDNMSAMPPWLSDAICRPCTGGGFAARTLYTDSEQTILNYCRPSVINGITDLATKGDLLERSILVELESITARKDEKAFWSEFEAARPQLLGALLDGVAAALANLPTLQMDNPPWMADFAKWATAAGPAFGWQPGEFMAAYSENIGKGSTLALEEFTFEPYLRQFAERYAPWEGSATVLLDGLNKLAMGSHDRQSRSWPSSASRLSGQLKRIEPALKAAGIAIDRDKTGKRGRLLKIELDPTV